MPLDHTFTHPPPLPTWRCSAKRDIPLHLPAQGQHFKFVSTNHVLKIRVFVQSSRSKILASIPQLALHEERAWRIFISFILSVSDRVASSSPPPPPRGRLLPLSGLLEPLFAAAEDGLEPPLWRGILPEPGRGSAALPSRLHAQ